MNEQKGSCFHSNGMSEKLRCVDSARTFHLTPPMTHHGNGCALKRSSNPKIIQETERRHLAWTGGTETGQSRLGRVQGQRSSVVTPGEGPQSSRSRSASRESTSARGARQKVKEVNWDRTSCRETDRLVRLDASPSVRDVSN